MKRSILSILVIFTGLYLLSQVNSMKSAVIIVLVATLLCYFISNVTKTDIKTVLNILINRI